MNRPNRHMRYRRSVYRRKRIKAIAICSAVAVLVLALLFLVIGNLIGNKVDESIESRKSRETKVQDQGYITPKSVNAYPIKLYDEDAGLSARLKKLSADGYKEICFDLDTNDGSLLYSSQVAAELDRQNAGASLTKLSDVTAISKELGLYTIAITHIPDFFNDNDLIRSAALGYHSALIAEALRAGVDEVLVFVSDVSIERYEELIALSDAVKKLCPDGTLGISLPVSAFSEAQDTTVANKLLDAFDYLSADLTVYPSDEVGDALGQMLYYLLRYNVRVLLPYSEDSTTVYQMITAVNDSGSQNIQIMPQQNT